MSGLTGLKFIVSKCKQGNSPAYARRQKLISKLTEQIQMAKAIESGTVYSPMKIRALKDDATGEVRSVEVPKRIKPWWWQSDNGKMCIAVRYGSRTIEVVEGKNAIEADNIAGVISTLEVIRNSVDAGELDSRIQAVSTLFKSGFEKDTEPAKRPKLKLSVKTE